MSGRRRIVFWLVLAAFVTTGVWWAFTVPHDPLRVYRAIPDSATFVSVHDNLASRWPDLSTNQMTLCLMSSLGVQAEEARKVAEDPMVHGWMRRLASRETAVAYVPSLGYSGQPAWVLASWVGGWSQRLQWAFSVSWSRRVKRLSLDDSTPMWACQLPFLRPNRRLSLALCDGMLLACLSPDPAGVRFMVAAAEGSPLVPSVGFERQWVKVSRHWPDGAKDRGWFSTPDGGKAGRGRQTFAFALSEHGTGGTEGRIAGNLDLPPATPVARTNVVELERMLGDAPEAIVILPPAYLQAALNAARPPLWTRVAVSILDAGPRSGDESGAFVALLGGAYSGRIKGLFGGKDSGPVRGLKVPAVLVGVRVGAGREAETHEAVEKVVDRMNVAFQWGLVPHRVAAGGRIAVALDETRGNAYGQLELDERVAYAVWNGWLIVCSNMGTLTKLLDRAWVSEDGRAQPQPRWAREYLAHPARAFGWVNFDSAGTTIRDGLAVYSLVLMARDGAGTIDQRRNLALAGAWAETCRPLKVGSLRLEPGKEIAALRFKLGN